MTVERLERWGGRAMFAGAVVLVVATVGERHWREALLPLGLLVVSAVLLRGPRREAVRAGRSARAARAWPLERVRELAAASGGGPAGAVQALRHAEPDLTLRDAHGLVQRALR